MTEQTGRENHLEILRQKLRFPGPVLDIHVHPLADTIPQGSMDAGEDADQLLAAARAFGITRLCLSSLGQGYPLEPDMQQCRKANDYALSMRDHAPLEIFPFCYVVPDFIDMAVKEIDRCVGENQMVGIKLWISRRASNNLLDPIMDCAGRYQVPVLQHAWLKTTGNLAEESTPMDVAALACRYPDVKIIMAHLYGANPRGLEAIRDVPNVLVDTSGGDPENGMLELAAARIGVERLIFGSDAPGRHFGVSLAKVLGSGLSQEQKAAILWGNAHHLLPDWAALGSSAGEE